MGILGVSQVVGMTAITNALERPLRRPVDPLKLFRQTVLQTTRMPVPPVWRRYSLLRMVLSFVAYNYTMPYVAGFLLDKGLATDALIYEEPNRSQTNFNYSVWTSTWAQLGLMIFCLKGGNPTLVRSTFWTTFAAAMPVGLAVFLGLEIRDQRHNFAPGALRGDRFRELARKQTAYEREGIYRSIVTGGDGRVNEKMVKSAAEIEASFTEAEKRETIEVVSRHLTQMPHPAVKKLASYIIQNGITFQAGDRKGPQLGFLKARFDSSENRIFLSHLFYHLSLCPEDPSRTLNTIYHETVHHEYFQGLGYLDKDDLVFRMCYNAGDEAYTSFVWGGALPQMQNELYAYLLENDFENTLRGDLPRYASADRSFYRLGRYFHPEVVLGAIDELERDVKRSELVINRKTVLTRLQRYRQLAEAKKATLDRLGLETYRDWQELVRKRANLQVVSKAFRDLRSRLGESADADWVLATDYASYLNTFRNPTDGELPEAMRPIYEAIKAGSFYEGGEFVQGGEEEEELCREIDHS